MLDVDACIVVEQRLVGAESGGDLVVLDLLHLRDRESEGLVLGRRNAGFTVALATHLLTIFLITGEQIGDQHYHPYQRYRTNNDHYWFLQANLPSPLGIRLLVHATLLSSEHPLPLGPGLRPLRFLRRPWRGLQLRHPLRQGGVSLGELADDHVAALYLLGPEPELLF